MVPKPFVRTLSPATVAISLALLNKEKISLNHQISNGDFLAIARHTQVTLAISDLLAYQQDEYPSHTSLK